MIARTVVYDAGMLVALLRGSSAAQLLHHGLRAAPHRPIITGPVPRSGLGIQSEDRARLQSVDHADIIIEQA